MILNHSHFKKSTRIPKKYAFSLDDGPKLLGPFLVKIQINEKNKERFIEAPDGTKYWENYGDKHWGNSGYYLVFRTEKQINKEKVFIYK